MRVAVLYGSVRSQRQGIGAARFVQRKLEERGHEVTLIDPLETPLPMLDRMYKEFAEGEAPEAMETIHQALDAADGIIVVCAEYNHSVPPALKNILDHFQSEYVAKPGGIVTYSAGPFAGVRVAIHLRALLGELGLVTPSIMFGIGKVGASINADGSLIDDAYDRRIQRFLGEFDWYMDALATKRAKDGPPF